MGGRWPQTAAAQPSGEGGAALDRRGGIPSISRAYPFILSVAIGGGGPKHRDLTRVVSREGVRLPLTACGNRQEVVYGPPEVASLVSLRQVATAQPRATPPLIPF